MKWILVIILIAATTAGDVWRSLGMKAHGEVQHVRGLLAALARNKWVILSTCSMAVSFFTFMRLVSIAPLSFAVPMSAAVLIPETILAKWLLKERVDWRRWAGAGLIAAGVVLISSVIAAALVLCGMVYNLLACIGAIKFRRRRSATSFCPPVSVLKSVHGRDEYFYEAIHSHAVQQYPEFELVFGIREANDSALIDIERLRQEFPKVSIRVINTDNDAENGKVGALEILAREARYPVMLVNDSDITVDPGYFSRVVGLLEDDRVGLVTCLYHATGSTIPAKAEAIGIATEFAPSVLVAMLTGAGGFALGSTMAFRKPELEAIGGFASFRDYLADDYQLGMRISKLGKRVVLSDDVVETHLGDGTWLEVWKHQLRWSRTIRVSRPGGYLGYLVTQATFWVLLAALLGHWQIALAGLLVRLCAAYASLKALCAGGFPELIFVPFRDLFGFAVWCAGLAGNEVEWRGGKYLLMRDGRIRRI